MVLKGGIILENVNEIAAMLGIKTIGDNRNYWLVRTAGGKYFNDFFFDEYIAIGWNKINLSEINQWNKKQTKEKIKELYPEQKRSGLIAGQLIRFVKELKKGDIVLVPDKDSRFVAFGEIIEENVYIENTDAQEAAEDLIVDPDEEIIEDDCVEEEDEDEDTDGCEEDKDVVETCPFQKRRKVKWIKTVKKHLLDINIYKLFHSHNTISVANSYAQYIDRTLYSFFIKDNKVHVIFEVKKKDEVNAVELNDAIHNFLSCVDVFNEITESDFDKKDIEMKIKVESPGPIEFISDAAGAGLLIGIVTIFLFGGKGSFKFTEDEQSGNIGTPGLFGTILKFREQKSKEKVIELEARLLESRENLNITLPKNEED